MPAKKKASARSAEYNKYHATPAAKKARAARNTARNDAEKAGRVSKGDGKVVHHKIKAKRGKPTKAGAIKKAKTAVISKAENTRKSNRER